MKSLRMVALAFIASIFIFSLALSEEISPSQAQSSDEILTNNLPYEIEVELSSQIVTVYRGGDRSSEAIVRQMICSSGEEDSTPLGVFSMPEVQKVDEREEWYYIGKYRLYVQYASRIVDDILFHSLPSEQRGASPTADSVAALGVPSSHGCIRLRPADSRWIALNCPAGTQVHIFSGNERRDELRALLLTSSFDAELLSYDGFISGERLFSISSEGTQVAALQSKLIEAGFVLEETDGFFGAQTHAAVVEIQLADSMEPTGELTETELTALLDREIDPSIAASWGRAARVRVKTSLALRSGPSSKSEKLDSLRDGALVRILEESGGWYKVRVGGITGYVGRKYIEIIDQNMEVN